jgi:hypothetical protein
MAPRRNHLGRCSAAAQPGLSRDNRHVADYEILQESDPRCAELEAAGYRVVAQSWAVRLHDPDRELLESAVRRAIAGGLTIRELGPESARALHTLEKTNESDYPYTPATHRLVADLASSQALWPSHRVFGACDGSRLVGATAIREHDGFGDTAFTSVLAPYRRRGIGRAVQAASILAFLDSGISSFSTGGAAANEASLRGSQSLGCRLTERWRIKSRVIMLAGRIRCDPFGQRPRDGLDSGRTWPDSTASMRSCPTLPAV